MRVCTTMGEIRVWEGRAAQNRNQTGTLAVGIGLAFDVGIGFAFAIQKGRFRRIARTSSVCSFSLRLL